MGTISAAEMEAHVRAGGTVVAASDRAARATVAAVNRAYRSEGREAWLAPHIADWQSFVRQAWQDRVGDLRLPLSALQEQALWERTIVESRHSVALLAGPRRNLASMAMRAHALLCSYAPRFLDAKARSSWDQDAGVFSGWLTAFDALCREEGVVSANRLALEAIPLLASDAEHRGLLLLTGFDRLAPAQEKFFSAWGEWKHVRTDQAARTMHYFAAPDPSSELTACARWSRQFLGADPGARILVIAQDVGERRGEFERAFYGQAAASPAFHFEFSLGVPLSQTAPVRSAQFLLRWLDGELAENELDWLFSTPYAGDAAECASLRAVMRALRDRGRQRLFWKVQTFIAQEVASTPLPETWKRRFTAAQRRIREIAQRQLNPTEWAEIVPSLLEDLGWTASCASRSAEFQVAQRWQQAVEACGSLGFDGRRMDWQTFLSELLRVMDETLFAPESEDAPILIAGPAESAGLTADAVWFLGTNDDAWPARGELHPLLPVDVQRSAGMPHASAEADWNLAQGMTARLVNSANEVHFSYARSHEGVEFRPSRLVMEFAADPHLLPTALIEEDAEPTLAHTVEDVAAIPYPGAGETAAPVHLRGGAALLTAQSQCPFKAFATGRLGASRWDTAQAALTAAERGQLLHEVLRSVWGGPPDGIRSLNELLQITDTAAFVDLHIQKTLSSRSLNRIREEMPARYVELEALRISRLVTEWLAYERTRVNFEVMGTERDKARAIAGLSLDLRLDRLDRLSDGSLLVIDYKTGNVTPRSWDMPRPDDVQLPLYAGFGLEEGEAAGGLVFAKLRLGEMCFAGRVVNARSTLDSTLKGNASLVKEPITAEMLMDWRDAIEQLARDFLAGRADVNPRDPPATCERCGLHTICRVQEREGAFDPDEAEAEND